MRASAWFVGPGIAVVGLVAGCARAAEQPAPAPAPAPRSAVTAQDLERNPDQSIESVLQAKYPGVQIMRTGDGIAIQLRGPGTFYSNGAALYVIDDVPMPAGRGGGISGLNPYDIESIRVLKNPEDIGIYGIRGSNGVVLITTKRPSKPQDP
jgi:TonB-dependent outer membrane receptor, SusC/RagA subfamily, signature region